MSYNTFFNQTVLTLTFQKKLVKNRFTALFTASKDEYSLFLKLTMSDMARFRKTSVSPLYTATKAFFLTFFERLGFRLLI